MPTISQIRNFVDARLATLWTDVIVPRQEQYASNHGGRYWQGIRVIDLADLPNNPQNVNATVLETAPDLTRKPTDQATSWADAAIDLGATLPMAIAIDVYNGPLGTGYVGQVWVRHNGTVYTRAQNHGPEDWRTFSWRVVPPLPPG
jgi:hypothetical protein